MRLNRCVRHGSVLCTRRQQQLEKTKQKENRKNRYIHRLLKQSVGGGAGASVSAKGTEDKTALKPLTTLCYTVQCTNKP